MFKRIALRAKDILTQPTQTFQTIASEPGGFKEAFFPYAMVMALGAPLTTIVMTSAIDALSFLRARPSFLGTAMSAVNIYAFTLAMIVLGAAIVWMLAPLFKAERSWVLSCRLLVYAYTPAFVAAFLGIIPIMGAMLGAVSIFWVLVLLYIGIGELLGVRGSRQVLYLLSILGISFLLSVPGWFYAFSQLRNAAQTASSEVVAPVDSLQAMERAADQQFKLLVLSGELTPAQAEVERKKFQKDMQEIRASANKSQSLP